MDSYKKSIQSFDSLEAMFPSLDLRKYFSQLIQVFHSICSMKRKECSSSSSSIFEEFQVGCLRHRSTITHHYRLSLEEPEEWKEPKWIWRRFLIWSMDHWHDLKRVWQWFYIDRHSMLREKRLRRQVKDW